MAIRLRINKKPYLNKMPAKKKRSQKAVDEGATSSKLRKKEPVVNSSPAEEGSEVSISFIIERWYIAFCMCLLVMHCH